MDVIEKSSKMKMIGFLKTSLRPVFGFVTVSILEWHI